MSAIVPTEIIGVDFPVYPDVATIPGYTSEEFETLPVKLRDAVLYQMMRDILNIHVELKHRIDVAEAQIRTALTKENATKIINELAAEFVGGMVGGKGFGGLF